MAPASNEEQFKFLISCIRYSNNGKVDFTEVARECSIVSKGAAAKRYERMMKAHGIHQSATTVRETPVPSRRRDKEPKGADAKKRKRDQFADGINNATDDDEGLSRVKDETMGGIIKQEAGCSGDISTQPGFFQYASPVGDQNSRVEDGMMFQDFLHAGAFEQDIAQSQSGYNREMHQPNHSSTGGLTVEASGADVNESIVIAD